MGATVRRRDALVVFERAEDAAIVLSELAEFDLGGRTVRVVRVGGGAAAPAAGSQPASAPVTASQSPPPTAVASEPSTPSDSGVAARPDRSTSSGFHYSDHGGEDASSTSSEPAELPAPAPAPAPAAAGVVAPAAAGAAAIPYDRYASNYGATFSGVDGAADDATRSGGDALAPVKKYGVWVGYFPEGRMIDRRAVMQLFSTLGQVHSVVVPKDPVTGRYGRLPPGRLAVRAPAPLIRGWSMRACLSARDPP